MKRNVNCVYPNCFECVLDDCCMEDADLIALTNHTEPEKAPKQKKVHYRTRRKEYLPHCDDCESCIRVRNAKGTGYQRICGTHMRIIEQKVTSCPHWCRK